MKLHERMDAIFECGAPYRAWPTPDEAPAKLIIWRCPCRRCGTALSLEATDGSALIWHMETDAEARELGTALLMMNYLERGEPGRYPGQ